MREYSTWVTAEYQPAASLFYVWSIVNIMAVIHSFEASHILSSIGATCGETTMKIKFVKENIFFITNGASW